MHHHVVLFTAWRYRRGLPGAEATLRRVADDGIVLVSTGGADLTNPRGEATRVDGGYRGQRPQDLRQPGPGGHRAVDDVPLRRPRRGPDRAQHGRAHGRPRACTVLETWDAMGMRGTGSHDIELIDVFVPDEQVLARRPHGRIDPPLQVILSNAMPPIAAVYLGVAEAARDHAVAAIAGTATGRRHRCVQRQVGLMDTRLRVAGWALDGALAIVGDDPTPVDGHGGRRHGRQAGDRPRRRRGLRPGHGGRGRRGLLPDASPSSGASATCRPPGTTPSIRRSRWSTPGGRPRPPRRTSAGRQRGSAPGYVGPVLSSTQQADYRRDGFLVLPGFVSIEACRACKAEAEALVDGFEPDARVSAPSSRPTSRPGTATSTSSPRATRPASSSRRRPSTRTASCARPRPCRSTSWATPCTTWTRCSSAFTHTGDLAEVCTDLGYVDPCDPAVDVHLQAAPHRWRGDSHTSTTPSCGPNPRR